MTSFFSHRLSFSNDIDIHLYIISVSRNHRVWKLRNDLPTYQVDKWVSHKSFRKWSESVHFYLAVTNMSKINETVLKDNRFCLIRADSIIETIEIIEWFYVYGFHWNSDTYSWIHLRHEPKTNTLDSVSFISFFLHPLPKAMDNDVKLLSSLTRMKNLFKYIIKSQSNRAPS